jgi:colicin import membrane protein
MAKGVPHALSGRRPAKPIIRPRRLPPKVVAAQAAAKVAAQAKAVTDARVADALAKADEVTAKVAAAKAAEAAAKAAKAADEAAAAKAFEEAAAAAAAEEEAAAAVEVPLELLDGSVKEVVAAVKTGEYDAFLAELLAAEKADKNRKTAIAAITDRMA